MTQEQAFINGFMKRADEYGFSCNDATELLKSSGATEFLRDPLKGPIRNTINHVGQKAVTGVYKKLGLGNPYLDKAPALRATLPALRDTAPALNPTNLAVR
jgi:hypothetical protein